MTDETKNKIIKALKKGANKTDIAKGLNISRKTLHNYLLKDKEMKMAMEYNKTFVTNIFES